jgi:hypothetical protein
MQKKELIEWIMKGTAFWSAPDQWIERPNNIDDRPGEYLQPDNIPTDSGICQRQTQFVE